MRGIVAIAALSGAIGLGCSDTTSPADASTGADSPPSAGCAADECDDSNPCTVDGCGQDGCVHTPSSTPAPCDDGDPCTDSDRCDVGQCRGDPVACNDGVDCTADSCADGECTNQPVPDVACEDGDPCTAGDVCTEGVCTGAAVDCDDGISCTADACEAVTGDCIHDSAKCACENDADCDDQNPCTTNSCVSGSCEETQTPGSCDDSDPCTVDDACSDGTCAGTQKDCDDGIPCTADACEALTGDCTHDSAKCACEDDADCDDQNPCTTNSCVSGSCEETQTPGSCDDGVPCTVDDACSDGTCAGTQKDCDDGVPCTADACEAVTGDCIHDPAACECDNDADCDDGISCTVDACDSASGACTHDDSGCGDDLTVLSDEFDDPSTLADWQRVYQVEGWPFDQLEGYGIGDDQAGWLTMMPYASSWYQDYRGVLVFKEVDGDFVATARVVVSNRAGTGPPAVTFSLAGILTRTPRDLTPDTWTAGGENYVFLSLGSASPAGQFHTEVKTTVNSVSTLEIEPGGGEATIRTARIGAHVVVLIRFPGGAWTVHRRYHRPDMPGVLQVGMTTYTDWPSVSELSPFEHNNTLITDGDPDLLALVDYFRYQRPDVPDALVGQALSDESTVTDAELLSFLGFD